MDSVSVVGPVGAADRAAAVPAHLLERVMLLLRDESIDSLATLMRATSLAASRECQQRCHRRQAKLRETAASLPAVRPSRDTTAPDEGGTSPACTPLHQRFRNRLRIASS